MTFQYPIRCKQHAGHTKIRGISKSNPSMHKWDWNIEPAKNAEPNDNISKSEPPAVVFFGIFPRTKRPNAKYEKLSNHDTPECSILIRYVRSDREKSPPGNDILIPHEDRILYALWPLKFDLHERIDWRRLSAENGWTRKKSAKLLAVKLHRVSRPAKLEPICRTDSFQSSRTQIRVKFFNSLEAIE